MPSLERGGPPGRPEESDHREFEPVPYHRVARFGDEQVASRAYRHAQDAVFQGPPSDLSVYRFLLDQVSHVAVLGELPPTDLDAQLTAILAAGEPATLPHEVLSALAQRRQQLSRPGTWLEGHYRPGRPL